MLIAVDFDGTVVEHEYPDVGPEVPGAFKWMKEWQANGASLMLWTMRDSMRESEGRDCLMEAVEFCRSRGVEFLHVNRNEKQSSWTCSPKLYANLYVDDAAFGCPLRENVKVDGRPYVDWDVVGPKVLEMLKAKQRALDDLTARWNQ